MIRELFHALLVGVGAALGGLTRWGVTLTFVSLLELSFPLGTLFVNVTGCFILGYLAKWLTDRLPLHFEEWRLLCAVGFCGGYTTFSTYEWEVSGLFGQGFSLTAIGYLVVSVVLGLLAVQLGAWLAERRDHSDDSLDDPEEAVILPALPAKNNPQR